MKVTWSFSFIFFYCTSFPYQFSSLPIFPSVSSFQSFHYFSHPYTSASQFSWAENQPGKPHRHRNNQTSLDLFSFSKASHTALTETGRQTNISNTQLAKSFYIQEDWQLWNDFFSPTSFLSVLFGCLGIYVSVQLYWILTGALNSYGQYDRLRKNNLNNSIAAILLVLINYFWQPYWFCGRAVPLWRFSSVPLWIFSPTQVQSYVWF